MSVSTKDISVKDVITVSNDRTVASAKSFMTYFKLDALIVTDENDPIGIITKNDIDRRVLSIELDPHLVCVREVCSEPLLWVRYNTTLTEVAQIMEEKTVKRLPIFGNLSTGPILLGLYVHEPSEIELEN
ncbi:cyclic nucleotide-binding/CBS domain-containing protein [Thermoproteota archaeon]